MIFISQLNGARKKLEFTVYKLNINEIVFLMTVSIFMGVALVKIVEVTIKYQNYHNNYDNDDHDNNKVPAQIT